MSDEHPEHTDSPDEHDQDRRADRGAGDDAESPGRSLIEDDDEIVEPNEPA